MRKRKFSDGGWEVGESGLDVIEYYTKRHICTVNNPDDAVLISFAKEMLIMLKSCNLAIAKYGHEYLQIRYDQLITNIEYEREKNAKA